MASVVRHNKAVRWNAIRRLVRERAIGTQDELARLLSDDGFDVTQATLSRDLTQLGAVRVSRAGGVAYELGGPSSAQDEELRELGQLVGSVMDNGHLVVLHTLPGAASAVARAIDVARMNETLGTVAGDDTIFVAPHAGTSAKALAKRLKTMFGKGEEP
jgi:transcriptional regulator of arginine metabolism